MKNKINENKLSSSTILPQIPLTIIENIEQESKPIFNKLNSKYMIKETNLDNEQYLKTLNRIMKNYTYEIVDDNLNLGNIKDHSFLTKKIPKNTKRVISSIDRSDSNIAGEDSLIKIAVKDEEFSNPIVSKFALEQNKNIYENMLKYVNFRSLNLNDKINKENKAYLNIANLNDINVKVSQLIAKRAVIFELKNRDKNKNKKTVLNNQTVSKPRLYYNKEIYLCRMTGKYLYNSKNYPEGRDQFCLSSDSNQMILFGGIVTNHSNNIWMLDQNKMEWTKIISENNPAIPRYGHTGVLFQRKLYVFGGRCKLDNFIIYGDLDVFNIDTRMWENTVIFTKPSTKRRNHIAKLIGTHILIHGGIDENGEYLKDSCLLSLNPLKWGSISIESESESPTLAYHDSCLVLPYDLMFSNRLNIYKLPEQNFVKKTISKIREKGLYVFGGKSRDDAAPTNDLWILKIGIKPLIWSKIVTNGTPPTPRYGHSMNFYEDGNFVIIHGGRNDSYLDDFALNDTYLLELSTFDWVKVEIKIDAPSIEIYKRCGHSSIVSCNYNILFQQQINY